MTSSSSSLLSSLSSFKLTFRARPLLVLDTLTELFELLLLQLDATDLETPEVPVVCDPPEDDVGEEGIFLTLITLLELPRNSLDSQASSAAANDSSSLYLSFCLSVTQLCT